VKNLALAFQMYLADNDDAFPAAVSWRPLLEGYLKNDAVLVCPGAEDGRGYYAYNASLSGRTVDDLGRPERVVIAFETDAARSLSGGPELLPEEPRHLGGDNYAFADGHATWSARQSMQTADRGEGVWQKQPVADYVWGVD
jgi:prepilin-type processing-associated H-X9-DG protein